MRFPMNTPWGYPDFDAHEALHFVTDDATGLRAIIAMHSTHLGPAAGGTRFWHYADDADALTDTSLWGVMAWPTQHNGHRLCPGGNS